jgi:hypothetical protein
MNRRQFIAAAGSVAVLAPASLAYARFRGGAVLDHAVPGVGLTVSGSRIDRERLTTRTQALF